MANSIFPVDGNKARDTKKAIFEFLDSYEVNRSTTKWQVIFRICATFDVSSEYARRALDLWFSLRE